MTNKEKLKKIIDKAKKNGYKYSYDDLVPKAKSGEGKEIDDMINSIILETHIPMIIFDKQFLKAFFGEEKQKDLELKVYYGEYEWQYHAQKLVLEDNKIDYLYKFV